MRAMAEESLAVIEAHRQRLEPLLRPGAEAAFVDAFHALDVALQQPEADALVAALAEARQLGRYRAFFSRCHVRFLQLVERREAARMLAREPADTLLAGFGAHAAARAADVVALLRAEPIDRLVVVGCGAFPATLLHAARDLQVGEVTGIDVDRAAVALARELAQRLGYVRARLEVGDGRHYDYRAADAVYVANQLTGKADVLARVFATAPAAVRVVVREPIGGGRLLAESVLAGLPPEHEIIARGDRSRTTQHAVLRRRSSRRP